MVRFSLSSFINLDLNIQSISLKKVMITTQVVINLSDMNNLSLQLLVFTTYVVRVFLFIHGVKVWKFEPKFVISYLYFGLHLQPTGEGGATRSPICIELKRDDNLSSKSIVLQIDSKSQPVSASESSCHTLGHLTYSRTYKKLIIYQM